MFKSLLSVLFSGCLLAVHAASPAIGIIKSPGNFRMDGSTIRGNSTVFEGSLIETMAARSVVELTGIQITLSPASRAKIFGSHTVLESGTGVVADANRHVIEAGTLRIESTAKNSVLQVEMGGPRSIVVSARSGAADVRNSAGVLVATVNTGIALAFDPQAAAPTTVKMTGILVARAGSFFLTDATSHVTVEVRGADVAKFAGKTVNITGTMVANAVPASRNQVIQITAIDAVSDSKAKPAAVPGATGAGKAAGAGTGAPAGIGTGATVAIIGGVAVGGTVMGLAAAGTFSDDSPVSRQ